MNQFVFFLTDYLLPRLLLLEWLNEINVFELIGLLLSSMEETGNIGIKTHIYTVVPINQGVNNYMKLSS